VHFSWHKLTMLAAVVWLLPASLGRAQGTIRYYQFDPPIHYAGFPGYDFRQIDMDLDGTPDFAISAGAAEVNLVIFNNNRLASFPPLPGESGTDVAPFQAGTQIGSSLDPAMVWETESDYSGGSSLSTCYDVGCIGLWIGVNAYMGVELDIGGSTHYGWIHIFNGGLGSVGEIYDWAYETRANTPIFAGAVPEPSCFSLCVLGILLMFTRRSKN